MAVARRKLNSIIARARRDAWLVVESEVRASLPSGWELHFAVGWGLTLLNAEGEALVGAYQSAARLPKGLRNA